MALGIEEIVDKFESLPPARGNRWNVYELIPMRLHLTRSEDGHFGIFLEGSKFSYGPLPALSELQHSDNVEDLLSGRHFSALRIRCGHEARAGRVLAHIAYELNWRLETNPTIDNAMLLQHIGWLLSLLGNQNSTMSPERQKGLVGECLFLRMLLLRCHELGLTVQAALDAWTGFDNSKRDFFRTGIAVEAKATGNATRLHPIGSLNQLLPQDESEQVFLFSVGLRQDSTAPRKLTNYIADIEALLVTAIGEPDDSALADFHRKILSYGFDQSQRDLYDREPGFLAAHLTPAIFRGTELRQLTASDFVGGAPPETVRSVSYVLEVMASPLDELATTRVIDQILSSPGPIFS